MKCGLKAHLRFTVHFSDRIGFHYWKDPGPFAQFKNNDASVPGAFGRFLAFWSVMIQAAFSFFGAEVPGVAGSEVRRYVSLVR